MESAKISRFYSYKKITWIARELTKFVLGFALFTTLLRHKTSTSEVFKEELWLIYG